MGEGDVAAGVGEEGTGVPGLYGSCQQRVDVERGELTSRTATSSKFSKSLHLLTQEKGFLIPRPRSPTQYDMSTMRESSSSSAKSRVEIVRLLEA